jgi:hypothetical protein
MRRSRFLLKRCVAALSTACVVALSCPAHAEVPQAEARAHELFQSGIEAVQRGELLLATERFEAAQALSPNPVVLYNLGQAYTALGRSVEAERVLELYLESETSPTEPKRTEEVEALLAYNARRLGTALVELIPTDANLEVDGSPSTPAVPGRLRLLAGRHVLVARRANYQARALNVDVPAAAEITVRLELEPLPSDATPSAVLSPNATQPPKQDGASKVLRPAEENPSVPATGLSARKTAGLAAIGAGAATLVVGGAFGLSAIRLQATANENGHCDALGCDADGLSMRSTAVRNGNWATGLCIGGAVAVGVGLVLYLLDPPRMPPRAARVARPSKASGISWSSPRSLIAF